MLGQDRRQYANQEPEGVIFEIQRWSSKDGPGIRTVVFFKGCPLRCIWCCNPESWSPVPQIAFFEERCQDCGQCLEACPRSIARSGQGQDRQGASYCTACGQCVAACPFGARELMGKRMSVEDVLSVIERDRVFYRQSGGGVTFSGGEALAQPAFLRELVGECWAAGLPMALESCGHFQFSTVKDILARMDLVFLDIKHMDPAIHRRVTGVDNRLILQNAIRIAREEIPLVIRIPLIPTINDSAENLSATAAFVSEELAGVLGVEVLPYHTLGMGKYQTIGLKYQLNHLAPPSATDVARAGEIFLDSGVKLLSRDYGDNSSSSVLASIKSAVSNPSVNQL
jgi:pyruvate formate lyase activating enzyme